MVFWLIRRSKRFPLSFVGGYLRSQGVLKGPLLVRFKGGPWRTERSPNGGGPVDLVAVDLSEVCEALDDGDWQSEAQRNAEGLQ